MKHLNWKTMAITALLASVSLPALGENEHGWSGGPGGFGDDSRHPPRMNGGRRGHGPRGPGGPGGMLLGRDGMKACAEAAGVTISEGERPEVSNDQRQQIRSCVEEKAAAIKSCVAAAGVTLPEPPKKGERPSTLPPKLDDTAKAAIESCRSQVLSTGNGAESETTDDAGAETNEVTATVNSAI